MATSLFHRFRLAALTLLALTPIVAATLAASSAIRGRAQAGEPAKAPAARLVEPTYLSEAARADLRDRMARHGNVMSNLVKAVVLLDRPTIKTLAQRIADEEVIARVEAKGSKSLESRLPKDFFAEQDALRAAARDLATAALNAETDSVLADRFATVAHTCVACHSVYLRGPTAVAK